MTDVTPGNGTPSPSLPRPVQVATAHYLDADGPRTAPVYEPSPATNMQRIQIDDIGPSWTFVREEPLAPITSAPSFGAIADDLTTAAAKLAASVIADVREAAEPLNHAADTLRSI